jgi:hypothetical protein
MKAKSLCRAVVVLVTVGCIGVEVIANAADQVSTNEVKSADEPNSPVQFNNWIEFSIGDFFVSGDKAQFQRRQGMRSGPFGGVEDFHWEQNVGKRGLFTIDGRGIFDNHDYDLRLKLSEPEKGYLQFGYREFRTWYDGSGGFYPGGTNHWFNLYNDEMQVDRGEVWFEGGLRIPDVPELTFRYAHDFRGGRKDSTIWGDTALLGISGANTSRGIVPSFRDIDEKRDIFIFDLKHKISTTDFGVGVRYDRIENHNSLNIHRRPGELTGSVTEAADRFVTQKDDFESDVWNGHAFTETRFNDKVLLTVGYSYTTLDTDVGGSRIYGASYDPVYDPLFARRQQRDEGFLDLHGGSQVQQHVGNINLMLTPWQSLVVVPSFRVEHQGQEGDAAFTETSVNAPPARAPTAEFLLNTREWDYTDVTEALDIRYTGVTNWVFYLRGEWLEEQGNLKERQADNDPDAPAPTNSIILRDTDSTRFTQKYLAGVNWYPLRQLNLSGQYYHKERKNDYNHLVDSTPNDPSSNNRYPAFLTDQNFSTDDVNFRFTLHPLNNLTLVTRYDFQLSTIDTKADLLAEVQSGEMHTHIISESIGWVPLTRLFVQATFNYSLDELKTGANDFFGSATNNIVPTSRNNYWNASALVGYALDDKTHLQAQYFYYRSDNYVDNSLFSQPYGAESEEHGITATLTRQLTKRLRWTLRYGFFNNRDITSGHHNDYTAHMVYSSWQYRF